MHEEALVISREMGHVIYEMLARNGLGGLARAEGDLATARARHAEALSALEAGDEPALRRAIEADIRDGIGHLRAQLR